MSTGKNTWLTASAAEPASALAALSEKANALLKVEQSPRQFVEVLLAAEQYIDAMKLIPFAIPHREAMWWAAQCIKAVPGLLNPKSQIAIDAVEKWCTNPTDEYRRAAMTAAETADLATPAGCAAMAVFLCEGSLAPPEIAVVAAPQGVGLSMAGNAVLLAAVIQQPEKAPERYSLFVRLADDVAAGTNRWVEDKSVPNAKPATPTKQAGAKEFPPYPQVKR